MRRIGTETRELGVRDRFAEHAQRATPARPQPAARAGWPDWPPPPRKAMRTAESAAPGTGTTRTACAGRHANVRAARGSDHPRVRRASRRHRCVARRAPHAPPHNASKILGSGAPSPNHASSTAAPPTPADHSTSTMPALLAPPLPEPAQRHHRGREQPRQQQGNPATHGELPDTNAGCRSPSRSQCLASEHSSGIAIPQPTAKHDQSAPGRRCEGHRVPAARGAEIGQRAADRAEQCGQPRPRMQVSEQWHDGQRECDPQRQYPRRCNQAKAMRRRIRANPVAASTASNTRPSTSATTASRASRRPLPRCQQTPRREHRRP